MVGWFGMLWRSMSIEAGEVGISEIHPLLIPEAAVVVEGGDELGGDNVVRRSGGGDFFDEVDNGLLWNGVVPRGKRVRGLCG